MNATGVISATVAVLATLAAAGLVAADLRFRRRRGELEHGIARLSETLRESERQKRAELKQKGEKHE